MRAGVYRGIRQIVVEEVAEPELTHRDVIVAVKACGVCGSDLHAYTDGLPGVSDGQVMGHEFAGEVIAAGVDVEGVVVGDRVAGFPVLPCGECPRCRQGRESLCDNWLGRSIGFGLPGAFAERVRIPNAVVGRNVHPLPESVSFSAGALAEPLAVAVRAVDQAELSPDCSAVVFGLGTIGLQLAQVLMARGVKSVVGVNRSRLRREVAKQLGMTAVESGDHLPARVREALGGREADLVFEASGAPQLFQAALETVRPGGTVVGLALYDRVAEIDATLVTVKELTVRGSVTYMPEQFAAAIDLLKSGRAVSEPLITQRYPLMEIDQAFEKQLDKGSAVKVMIMGD